MRYLGVIPARGGSKRLPGKNIKMLGGKPLICHTIDAAHEAAYSGVEMQVWVSTEDAVIAHMCRDYGSRVLHRPEELAQDDTTTGEVALHALETLESRGFQYDAVVILHPTSPFRTATHIKEAIEVYEIEQHASNTPCPVASSSQLPRKKHKNVCHVFNGKWDYYGGYIMNGAIYIVPVYLLKKNEEHAPNWARFYEMDEWSSIDIDGEFDWLVAEAVYENKNPHKSAPAATCEIGEWGATPSYASADRIRMETRTRDSASGVPSHHLSRREGSLGPGDNFWDSPSEASCPHCGAYAVETGSFAETHPGSRVWRYRRD